MGEFTPDTRIRRRLSPEERRQEILQAAKRVFLTKGYKNCSMADLVFVSGLSAGGFYHYYREKADVLYDLIEQGSKQRFDLSVAFRREHPELSETDLIVELTMAKLLDDNEWKQIYAVFLQELKGDDSLQKLYDHILDRSRRAFDTFCRENDFADLGQFNTDFFIALTNCFYLGIEMLDLRPLFQRNKAILRKMILMLIENQEPTDNESE